MNTQTNNTAANVPATTNDRQVTNLHNATTSTGKNLTGKQLKNKLANDKAKELRKATNEAAKEFKQLVKEERAKLSYHYKQLQNFGYSYVSKLSAEIGRQITTDEIKTLKYSNFLPFLTEKEDFYNSVSGWNEQRFINVVSRYFRNEAKNQVKDSILSDIE